MLIIMSNIAKKLMILTSLNKTVFTTNELAIIWKIESKNVLRVIIARAIKNSYLQSIQRGIYKLKNRKVATFELAGKLKKHSYISFETVLSQTGVIFQWHDEIISASNRKFTAQNQYGQFIYRKLPADILLNRIGIINKGNYFIATPERALCDKIYKDGLSYFDNLSELNRNETLKISKIYGNKRLRKDIKKLF